MMSTTGHFNSRLDKRLSGAVQVNPALRQSTARKALKVPFTGVCRIYPSRSFSDPPAVHQKMQRSVLPYRG